MDSRQLFDESLKCLLAHLHLEWGDQDSFDVFTRLLAKNIQPPGWTKHTHLDIQPEQVISRREPWTTDALGRIPRLHKDTGGEDFACPIIIAEYDGVRYILDGNHRINRWVDAGDTRIHPVNFHTITGSGQFIELPAVTDKT